ncbi:MAG: GNAT family N-acetyltransferase [Candidatus Eremiobacteraeota bacterium]|nr:GNAT family N-acetyltransferase [Candidatus Eremiobacteraeota bacterium]
MRLAEIPFEDYAREVLPQTAELWAGRRNFESYVAQSQQIARSGYGRRNYSTIGLYDGGALVASIKRYGRALDFGPHRLRAVGIGAVFTSPQFRGRGYASAMLASLLDDSRNAGFDLAYLFSDIRPEFYREIGFEVLPSRAISMRSDGLSKSRVEVRLLEEGDWSGVRRCYELNERIRPWGFARTPLVWEWIRLRMRHGSERPVGVQTNLVVRRGRAIAAYVMGLRAPENDAYILDEYGFADAQAALLVAPLLRSAAGDLRRITGWAPPEGVADVLGRASIRKRKDAIFMAAPLSHHGAKWLQRAGAPNAGDGVWSFDHI